MVPLQGERRHTAYQQPTNSSFHHTPFSPHPSFPPDTSSSAAALFFFSFLHSHPVVSPQMEHPLPLSNACKCRSSRLADATAADDQSGRPTLSDLLVCAAPDPLYFLRGSWGTRLCLLLEGFVFGICRFPQSCKQKNEKKTKNQTKQGRKNYIRTTRKIQIQTDIRENMTISCKRFKYVIESIPSNIPL